MFALVVNHLISSLMLRVGNRVVLWWCILAIRMLCRGRDRKKDSRCSGSLGNTDPLRRQDKGRERVIERDKRIGMRQKGGKRGAAAWREGK